MMAFQFPNFLAAPIDRPDYSGIGDAVSNFYAGKAMPNDDLIKRVQAQFAKPNAEAALAGTKLSNRKSQLEIEKYAYDLAQQKAMEQMLKQALSGGGGQAGSAPVMGGAGGGNMTIPQQPAQPSAPLPMTYANAPSNILGNIIPDMGNAMSQALQQPGGNPVAPPALAQQPEEHNEITINKGSPHLAGVDRLYDENPLSRAFLEAKGFKKKQEVKFDNKTGKTSILTTYPSGRMTLQSAGGSIATGEGIPLTSKMISKHQNIVSSIDNALPVIQEILDLNKQEKGTNGKEKDKYWEPYPRTGSEHWYQFGLGSVPGYKSAATKYEALVNSALDSLVGAYGLPSTNEGIETVRKQLQIGHGETDAAYTRRIKELVKDLERRKSYAENQVKRSNKIQPVGRMANEPDYSSNDWEQTDAQ